MEKKLNFKNVSYSDAKEFGKNQENRKINQAHLRKIKKQMLKSMELIPAITVNTLTNNIIDGQHRCKAFIELVEGKLIDPDTKLKVMFVEVPIEKEKEAIIDANTNSKNWSIEDYILSYVNAGIPSYIKLDEWCKTHYLTCEGKKSKFRYGASIITGKRCSSELKNGKFDFPEENLKTAEDVHAELIEIIELYNLNGKGDWIEGLAVAWHKVRGLHPFKEWRKEFKRKKPWVLKQKKEGSKEWDIIFSTINTAIILKNN